MTYPSKNIMEEYFIEESTMYDRVLDFLVFLSVFVVTIFLIMEVFQIVEGLSEVYLWISIVVLAIFALDLVRLRQKADSWSDFFANSWLDILATIPFELIAFGLGFVPNAQVSQFAILKMFRITKLSRAGKISQIARVSKVSKEFKAAAHMKDESDKFKEKNRL